MSQSLPPKPSLVHLRKQAKDLLAALKSGDPETAKTFALYFPTTDNIGLIQAQLVLAREYGFDSWAVLKRHVTDGNHPTPESFIDAAKAGRVDDAKAMWLSNKAELRKDPVVAAMAGDVDAIREYVRLHPTSLRDNFPPKIEPLLVYACTSRLVADAEFEAGIVGVTDFLLKSGANPDAFTPAEWGGEQWHESALYGAAGVLNHAGLTKLLLDAGADPNDNSIEDGVYRGESLYHACDHPGRNECLRLILEANPAQVAADYCIKRKLDFEDIEGLRLFLDHGANPNANKPRTALSHAILRGRSLETLQILLDAGADPNQPDLDGATPYVLARRLANKEASALVEAHGAVQEFTPYDAILIAAADGDEEGVQQLAKEHPEVVASFTEIGRQEDDGMALGSAGQILLDLARLGHAKSLEALLDLGMSPGLKNQYNETALHWACVAGRAEAARLLVSRGAPLDIREKGHNCVPIQWAYWGSEYWNEPFGDYAATVAAVLDGGMALPDKLQGSKAVQDVLRSRGCPEGNP